MVIFQSMLLLRLMSGSMFLLQPGSVLMSITYVTKGDHADVKMSIVCAVPEAMLVPKGYASAREPY